MRLPGIQSRVRSDGYPKGTIVSVRHSENCSAIRCLKSQCGIVCEGHEVKSKIMVGQELVLYRNSACPDRTARRKVQVFDLADGYHQQISEFSFLSYVSTSPLIARVLHAPEHRAIAQRIIKAAAAVQEITAKHGYYELPSNRNEI